MNLTFLAAVPQRSGAGQVSANLKGSIVPEGFAFLTQLQKPTEAPILPGDAATVETIVASAVALKASGAAELLVTVLPNGSNLDQGPEMTVPHVVVGGGSMQGQTLDTVGSHIAAGHRLNLPVDSPLGSAVWLVPIGKSGAALMPSMAIEQPMDQHVAEQKITLETLSASKVLVTQAQTTLARREQDIVQLGRQFEPLSKSLNQTSPKLSDIEVASQQPTIVKVASDAEIPKHVLTVQSPELGVPRELKTHHSSSPLNIANTNMAVATTAPSAHLSEVAKQAAGVSETQRLPQLTNLDKKSTTDRAPSPIVIALNDPTKHAGVAVDGPVVEGTEGNLQVARLPVAMIDVSTKLASLLGQKKPATGLINLTHGMTELGDVLGRAQPPSVSVLAPGTSTAAFRAVLAQDANSKSAPKPFTEALMAQVKSVETSRGHTTVNLMPAGLGSIEVEIISEKDVASKVIVRVENQAVLQALRDDRQFLAQAIGVSDSSIFDFQEQGAGDQSSSQHKQNGQGGDLSGDTNATRVQRQHIDVVHEGQLNILT